MRGDEHRHKRGIDNAQVGRAMDLQCERIDDACEHAYCQTLVPSVIKRAPPPSSLGSMAAVPMGW